MLNEVISIVSEQSGVPIDKINGDTLIEEDLGVTGDDAWEVIEALDAKYNIDFKELEFLKHFGPEAGWSTSKDYGYYPVSINHLVMVAENKKWLMPEKDESNYIKQKNIRKKRRIKNVIIIMVVSVIFILYNKYA